jgi:hypothetical protein
MDKPDIDKMFMEQAGLFKRLLSDNISEMEKNSKRFENRTREFYSIRTKVVRSIEFSNIHISIYEHHELSHIPRIGERVNSQKVKDVHYRIEGIIQSAEITLEAESRANEHLSFDEAKILIFPEISVVLGNLPEFPYGPFHTIYDSGITAKVLGIKPNEWEGKFINSDQFNQLFPKLEVSGFLEGQDTIQRRSIWKTLLSR